MNFTESLIERVVFFDEHGKLAYLVDGFPHVTSLASIGFILERFDCKTVALTKKAAPVITPGSLKTQAEVSAILY
jgi:hypothetical protein